MIELYQKQQKVKRKKSTYKSAYSLYEGRGFILNAFRKGIFPIKETKG